MCAFSVEESHVCTETHKRPGAFPKKLTALEYTEITKRGGALALDSSETWKLASKPRLPLNPPGLQPWLSWSQCLRHTSQGSGEEEIGCACEERVHGKHR